MLGALALPGRLRTSGSGFPRGGPETPPSQEPLRPCEDGGGGGPALLRRLRWNLLPQLRGRSGSLTRTGKRCGGKRPVSASSRLRRLIASPLAAGSRATASCCWRCCSTLRSASASWSCASSWGSTSSWSAAPCRTASSAGAGCGGGAWGAPWAGPGPGAPRHRRLCPLQVRGPDHVCGPGARGPAGGLRTPGSPRQGPHFQPCHPL